METAKITSSRSEVTIHRKKSRTAECHGMCYKYSKTKVPQYFKDATETLVQENKCKQQHFHNIQAGWDCSGRRVCAVHPAEKTLMRSFQFPVSCLQNVGPEVINSAAGWVLGCTVGADASLSWCGIWT